MEIIRKKYKDYNFGFSKELKLKNEHFEKLIKFFNEPQKPSKKKLGGRAEPFIAKIDGIYGIGKVVIKHYIRGGIIGKFIKKKYIKIKNIRSESEYIYLNQALSIGVNAPKPLIFAYKGRFIYKAWLVTEYIQNSVSLIELIESDKKKAYNLLNYLNLSIKKLIENKIYHVDLHPGNVLIGEGGKVYLIDFDKAKFYDNQKKLEKKYIKRWRRAGIKYNLSGLNILK
jgi:3-deoxy-D-manno-octulosonic acid kinase